MPISGQHRDNDAGNETLILATMAMSSRALAHGLLTVTEKTSLS